MSGFGVVGSGSSGEPGAGALRPSADASSEPVTVGQPLAQLHQQWMHQALQVARLAGQQGEIPVGAIVVSAAGQVMAQAGNLRECEADPTAHAEVVALRQAAAAARSWRLPGATLVVTLEPCTMCAGAILQSQVSTLVFGAFDPKAGAVGSLYDVIRDPRHNVATQVYAGVLAQACGEVLRQFFIDRR